MCAQRTLGEGEAGGGDGADLGGGGHAVLRDELLDLVEVGVGEDEADVALQERKQLVQLGVGVLDEEGRRP
jgi:hypothetical protein